SWGRVSRHGAMPLAHSLDTIGPLARSAEDCALVYGVIAGRDARDPLTAHAPAEVATDGEVRTVAISSAWIKETAHAEVAQAVLTAARHFNLVEVSPPAFDILSAHCLTVMQAEASAQ